MKHNIVVAGLLFTLTACTTARSPTEDIDSEPLSAFVSRFNRENQQQILIADSAAGKKRISGIYIYLQSHPQGAVIAIRDLFRDLRVTTTDIGWVVATRADKPNEHQP